MLTDGTLKHVWGVGLAYATTTAGAVQQVYHADGLGSVRALTNASGAMTETYQTDEFGVVSLTQGSVTQPFRFAGEQRDGETGFEYLRARYYLPSLGRFLSRDTILGAPSSPMTLNRYSYVQNDPASLIDPSGLMFNKVSREGSTDNDCFSQDPTGSSGLLFSITCLNMPVGVQGFSLVEGPDGLTLVPTIFLASPSGGDDSPPRSRLFDKAGIKTTYHFLLRLAERAARGVTEEVALRAYNRGRIFYDPETGNFIRHDAQTGISVVVDRPSGGKAITVFEGNPSPRWVPVPWRPG